MKHLYTKEEFMPRYNDMRNPIIEKYGGLLYFIIFDVFNISAMEKLCEQYGYTTNRVKFIGNEFQFYSEIYKDNKVIGIIDNQGLPSITLYKRNKKRAIELSKSNNIINPIKGVHGINDWHKTNHKLHILANDSIVLHLLPVEIPDESIIIFLTDTNLIDRVAELKQPRSNPR